MKTLLLVCDFEEFNLPFDFGKEISEEMMLEISNQGVRNLAEFILSRKLKMTFFVTEKMAVRYQDLLRQLSAQGHEIGLHASIENGSRLDRHLIISDLRRAKNNIEDVIKTKLYGFRNHKLFVLPAHIIKEAGFLYDNTCHPTYVPGRYCNLFMPNKINVKCGLVNIPISVTPILRLPFSWVWFRSFGLGYLKFCTSWTYLVRSSVNIYFHSWEFADIHKNPSLKLPYLITHNTGERMLKFLDDYLMWCERHNIKFDTIHSYLSLKKNGFLYPRLPVVG